MKGTSQHRHSRGRALSLLDHSKYHSCMAIQQSLFEYLMRGIPHGIRGLLLIAHSPGTALISGGTLLVKQGSSSAPKGGPATLS